MQRRGLTWVADPSCNAAGSKYCPAGSGLDAFAAGSNSVNSATAGRDVCSDTEQGYLKTTRFSLHQHCRHHQHQQPTSAGCSCQQNRTNTKCSSPRNSFQKQHPVMQKSQHAQHAAVAFLQPASRASAAASRQRANCTGRAATAGPAAASEQRLSAMMPVQRSQTAAAAPSVPTLQQAGATAALHQTPVQQQLQPLPKTQQQQQHHINKGKPNALQKPHASTSTAAPAGPSRRQQPPRTFHITQTACCLQAAATQTAIHCCSLFAAKAACAEA